VPAPSASRAVQAVIKKGLRITCETHMLPLSPAAAWHQNAQAGARWLPSTRRRGQAAKEALSDPWLRPDSQAPIHLRPLSQAPAPGHHPPQAIVPGPCPRALFQALSVSFSRSYRARSGPASCPGAGRSHRPSAQEPTAPTAMMQKGRNCSPWRSSCWAAPHSRPPPAKRSAATDTNQAYTCGCARGEQLCVPARGGMLPPPPPPARRRACPKSPAGPMPRTRAATICPAPLTAPSWEGWATVLTCGQTAGDCTSDKACTPFRKACTPSGKAASSHTSPPPLFAAEFPPSPGPCLQQHVRV